MANELGVLCSLDQTLPADTTPSLIHLRSRHHRCSRPPRRTQSPDSTFGTATSHHRGPNPLKPNPLEPNGYSPQGAGSRERGSSLITALIAGTIGIILLVVVFQAVALTIAWIQLNATADHAATLAASDLNSGVTQAIATADSSIYSSGIYQHHDLFIVWNIVGQSVGLTLRHDASILTIPTPISAQATATVN